MEENKSIKDVYEDVMVDIETTGLDPSNCAIIQLAAVKFNLESFRVYDQVFCKSMIIPKDKFWELETINFWNSNRAVYSSIMESACEPAEVMRAFAEWVGYRAVPARFWSKPSHFDFPFIEAYFKRTGITSPFHYRRVYDLRSFLCGLKKDCSYNLDYSKAQGNKHNALDDVFTQLEILFSIYSEYQKNELTTT